MEIPLPMILRNRLLSARLETVLIHIKKSCSIVLQTNCHDNQNKIQKTNTTLPIIS